LALAGEQRAPMTGRLDRVTTGSLLRALRRVEFGPVSIAILGALAERPGRICTYAEMAERVWGADGGPDDCLDNFRVLIGRMRKRGVPIVAHKGRGYSLERAA